MPVTPEPGCAAVELGDVTVDADTCCSPSVASSTLCTPTGTPIAVVVATPCGACDADDGDPAVVGWVDLTSGAFTAGAPPAGAEPCAAAFEPPCATVSTVTLCDLALDGDCTRFLRHMVLDCDGTVTAHTDTDLTGAPYTPAGTVADCSDCLGPDETRLLELCDTQLDGTSVAFLRWFTVTADGTVTASTDTELDGVSSYTPTGVVGVCGEVEPCQPVPMCARLTSVTGPDDWIAPDGIESLSLHVTAGPVTVIDCAGEETVLPEGCGSLSWSAPGGPCVPGVLCGPFIVSVDAGSTVLINWLEPCEES